MDGPQGQTCAGGCAAGRGATSATYQAAACASAGRSITIAALPDSLSVVRITKTLQAVCAPGWLRPKGGQEFTRISRAVCGDDAGGGRSVVDFPPECHGVLERVGEAFLAIADAGGAGAGVVEVERVWRGCFVSVPPVSAEISDGGGKTA